MLLGSSHRIHGTDWYICRRLVDVFMVNVTKKTLNLPFCHGGIWTVGQLHQSHGFFFQRPLTLLMVALVKDKNIILSQHDPRIYPPGNQHGPWQLAIPKRNSSSNPWFSGDMSVSRSLGLGMIVRDVNRKYRPQIPWNGVLPKSLLDFLLLILFFLRNTHSLVGAIIYPKHCNLLGTILLRLRLVLFDNFGKNMKEHGQKLKISGKQPTTLSTPCPSNSCTVISNTPFIVPKKLLILLIFEAAKSNRMSAMDNLYRAQ